MRLFDVPSAEVVAAVQCSWCGARIEAECVDGSKLGDILRRLEVPHAQRWRDYWNATADAEAVEVYPAPWRATLEEKMGWVRS